MALHLEFDSTESPENINGQAWNHPKIRETLSQVIALQTEKKRRLKATFDRLLPRDLEKKTPSVRLNLRGLHEPEKLDLNPPETAFLWRDEENRVVRVSDEETRLHLTVKRLLDLLAVAGSDLDEKKAIKIRSESAKLRIQKDLDYLADVGKVNLGAIEADEVTGFEKIDISKITDQVFEARAITEHQQVVARRLWETQREDREKDLEAIRKAEGLPDLNALEQGITLNTSEKERLRGLLRDHTIDDENLPEFQELLHDLVERADFTLTALGIHLPPDATDQPALKNLLEDPILCEFRPSSLPEHDRNGMLTVVCFVLLAVAATVAGFKLTNSRAESEPSVDQKKR